MITSMCYYTVIHNVCNTFNLRLTCQCEDSNSFGVLANKRSYCSDGLHGPAFRETSMRQFSVRDKWAASLTCCCRGATHAQPIKRTSYINAPYGLKINAPLLVCVAPGSTAPWVHVEDSHLSAAEKRHRSPSFLPPNFSLSLSLSHRQTQTHTHTHTYPYFIYIYFSLSLYIY